MSLATLLMERFKVKTRAVQNPKITAAGATVLEVLGNNPNRLGFSIVNLSLNPVYLALSNDVSANKGIRLDPSGGSMSMIWDEDFQMVGWAWWVIAPAGASNIFAVEVLEY